MSLINDALKRARQSTQNQPPRRTGDSPLQPVHDRRSHGIPAEWVMAALVGMMLTVAVWFFWQWISRSESDASPGQVVQSSQRNSEPAVSSGRTATKSPPAPASTNRRPVLSSQQESAAPTVNPSNTSTAPPPQAVSPPATSSLPAVIPAPKPRAQTNSSASLAPQSPPKPRFPEFELQGLSTGNTPWARVNGQMVFVGDQIQGATVVNINDQGVTVQWNGETNLITF